MGGLDFLLESRPDDAALAQAFAQVLELPVGDVQVVSSAADIEDGTPVALEVTPTAGDFSTQLAVYTSRDLGVEEVADIAAALHTRALVPDDSPNPYTMLLVDGHSPARPVSLDVESVDERGEYCLASAPPSGS
jgi:hypothetical protein